MKAYTDIEQSKNLAEILPLESADMCYRYYSGGMITGYGDCVFAKSFITGKNVIRENDLPCWSLTALLNVLPKQFGRYTKSLYWFDNSWHCDYMDEDSEAMPNGTLSDNPVDACVTVIEKLHELNML